MGLRAGSIAFDREDETRGYEQDDTDERQRFDAEPGNSRAAERRTAHDPDVAEGVEEAVGELERLGAGSQDWQSASKFGSGANLVQLPMNPE